MIAMTTLTAATPIWLICVYLFVFGAGLGLIMQVVVLVVQNAVPAAEIGTATSTNNYFREVGAALGIAVFGTIFTTRLTENLHGGLHRRRRLAADAGQRDRRRSTRRPSASCRTRSATAIVNAYADALAPVFWYLLPFIGIAFVLALFLKQIPLSDVAGLVARGEAIGGDEAELLEAQQRAAGTTAGVTVDERVAEPVGSARKSETP